MQAAFTIFNCSQVSENVRQGEEPCLPMPTWKTP